MTQRPATEADLRTGAFGSVEERGWGRGFMACRPVGWPRGSTAAAGSRALYSSRENKHPDWIRAGQGRAAVKFLNLLLAIGLRHCLSCRIAASNVDYHTVFVSSKFFQQNKMWTTTQFFYRNFFNSMKRSRNYSSSSRFYLTAPFFFEKSHTQEK